MLFSAEGKLCVVHTVTFLAAIGAALKGLQAICILTACYTCPAWLNPNLLISCSRFLMLWPVCNLVLFQPRVVRQPLGKMLQVLLTSQPWSMECESVLRIRRGSDLRGGTCHSVVKVPELIKSQRLSWSFINTTTVDLSVIVIWHQDWLLSPISAISLCTGFEIFQHVTVDISVSIYTPQEVEVGK